MRALVLIALAWISIAASTPIYKAQEVQVHKTATVKCHSNDADHNFMFWASPTQLVIGPGNDFDKLKYDYEILTGTLIIKSVTVEDEGNYECVSRGIRNDNINIKIVKLLVLRETQGSSSDTNSIHFFALVIGVGVIIICSASAFLIYKNFKSKEFNQLNISDHSDEDESGEDIYSKAGPSTREDFLPKKKDTLKSAFVNPAMGTDLKNNLINVDE